MVYVILYWQYVLLLYNTNRIVVYLCVMKVDLIGEN